MVIYGGFEFIMFSVLSLKVYVYIEVYIATIFDNAIIMIMTMLTTNRYTGTSHLSFILFVED